MPTPGFEDWVVHGLGLLAALLYVAVGVVLQRRRVRRDERGPLMGFVLWWYGLAVVGVVGAVFGLGVDLAAYGLTVTLGVLYLLLALIYAMIGGLVYYLLYLYTGHRAWLWAVLGFYVVQFAFLVWLVQSQGPYIGIGETGRPELLFTDQRAPGDPVSLLFTLGLLVPPLGAAGAYMALYWRLDDRTLRYRVLLVSGGLVLWFTYSLLGSVLRSISGVQEAGFLGQVAGQLLGIVAGALVLAAYHPPGWVRRWLHVEGVNEPRGASAP